MWTNAYSTRDIGRHLARIRKDRGLTQAQFARSLGVHRSTLSSLENGGPVSSDILVKAVSLLGSRIVIAPKADRVTVTHE